MNNDLFDLDIQIQKGGTGSVIQNTNCHYYGTTCYLDSIGCYTVTCGGQTTLPATMYSCRSNCDYPE